MGSGREVEQQLRRAEQRPGPAAASAGTALVLLHGLGATRAVWAGVARIAGQRWEGPLLAPDLGGHGSAPPAPPYSFGGYAAEVGRLLAGVDDAVVVGHSMGGVVALALASGWFGVRVRAAVGIGIKVGWTEEELARAAELAARPARHFPTRSEATARYLRVAGLEGLLDPEDAEAIDGAVHEDGGWRLAQDPATFGVGAPDLPGLLAAARAPVVLAAGEHDAMCPPAALDPLPAPAVTLPGLGHNAHVEDPAAVWDLVARAAGESGTGR